MSALFSLDGHHQPIVGFSDESARTLARGLRTHTTNETRLVECVTDSRHVVRPTHELPCACFVGTPSVFQILSCARGGQGCPLSCVRLLR